MKTVWKLTHVHNDQVHNDVLAVHPRSLLIHAQNHNLNHSHKLFNFPRVVDISSKNLYQILLDLYCPQGFSAEIN